MTQAAGLGPISWNGYAASFPDPFNDMASLAVPETVPYMLRWAEYCFLSQGTYRAAIDRVLSYFITDIEVASPIREDKLNDEEKMKYETFFKDTLGIYRLLRIIGLDYMCYGNAFVSVIMPFKRFLFCPKCFLELPLREVYNNHIFSFKWNDFDFHAKCPKCHYSGVWGHNDRKGHEEDLIIKRWNPHEIELLWDPITDNCTPIWKIPAEYRKMIREGHLYHLERANWEVVQAIKNSNHLIFEKDFVFHLKEDVLAGVRNRGWGIPRVITNFRQLWYVQVLHRYNEAIALDYVIPFRIITPAPQGGSGDMASRDPINNMNLGGFMSRVGSMLRERRRDPAAWFSLPFPVQYQTLGGDATKLAPKELLDQGLETLLNNAGIPVELFKGSLQIQSAPAALRLFESNWSHLIHNMNRLLAFFADKVSDMLMWEPVTIKLTRVTHADNLNNIMASLQLASGKQISMSSGLKPLGLDFREETRRLIEEERYTAEQQAKLQKIMDQEGQMSQMGQPQQGGQPGQDPNAAGGQPQPGGQAGGTPMVNSIDQLMADIPPTNSQPTSVQELNDLANTKAQQILGMDPGQRQSALIALKKKNPTLHGIVKSIMDSIKNKAKSTGAQQVLAQQYGGGQQGQQQQ